MTSSRGSTLTVVVVGLLVALAGCSSPSEPEGADRSPAASSSSSAGDAEDPQALPGDPGTTDPADGGERVTSGGVSFVVPDGWVGGALDAESVERTLADIEDPQVREGAAAAFDRAAEQGALASMLDLRDGDVATAGVTPVPDGIPPDEMVDGLVEVFRDQGVTEVTTGTTTTPLGEVRSIATLSTEAGRDVGATFYLLDVASGGPVLAIASTAGRDTADLEAVVASLRRA